VGENLKRAASDVSNAPVLGVCEPQEVGRGAEDGAERRLAGPSASADPRLSSYMQTPGVGAAEALHVRAGELREAMSERGRWAVCGGPVMDGCNSAQPRVRLQREARRCGDHGERRVAAQEVSGGHSCERSRLRNRETRPPRTRPRRPRPGAGRLRGCSLDLRVARCGRHEIVMAPAPIVTRL
jgi:hypothetical protein